MRWFPSGFEPEDDDLLAFFHSQRTGGISFREQLRRIYGDPAIYSLSTVPRYRHWKELTPDDLAPFRAFAGHALFAEKALGRRWLPVSIVREPVDRVVSLYRMIRDSSNYDVHAVQEGEDLEAWARRVHEARPDYLSDAQTNFMCGAADADYALEVICERSLGVGVSTTSRVLDRGM